MKISEYSQIMAENGRKGGYAKGQRYANKVPIIVLLFARTNLTQNEIAIKVGVSQAMVSKYTNDVNLKIQRLQNGFEQMTEIEKVNLLLEIQLPDKPSKKKNKI
jgi:hypothetical protein